jgi:hypothetical protein
MKKRVIITMLLLSVVLTGCSTKGEIEKEYFDFTPSEIVSELEECSIDFTAFNDIDGNEKGEKIASYSSKTNIFTTNENNIDETIHYQFIYDDITEKVSHISFFTNRKLTLAAERYLYHIFSIIECIEPNVNTDEISSVIEKGFNEHDFAIYTGEKFKLHVSRSEEYFNASFTPIKKGE